MKSFLSARALVVMSIVGAAFVACGGSIEQSPEGSGGGDSKGGGSSSGGGGSSSSGGGSTSGGGSSSSGGGSTSGGATCVDIETQNFDTSCQVDSDCTEITSGNLCGADNCLCGGSTINVDGQAQYESLLSKLPPQQGVCGCPFFGTPTCALGTCTICPPAGSGIRGGAPGCPDAG